MKLKKYEGDMKFAWSITALLLILLVSCAEVEKPVADDETRIKGHILLPNSDEIILSKDNPYDFGNEYEVITTAKIDTNGNFTVTFPCKELQVVQLRDKSATYFWKLYVYPGDELHIDYDNANRDDIKVKFQGKSAPANNYVRHFAQQFQKDRAYYEYLNMTDVEKFNEWADQRREEMVEYYKNYFVLDTVPEIVDVIENSNINYEWAYVKNEWAIRNYYYQPQRWDSFELPDSYFNFLKQVKIQEPYLNFFLSRYLESLIWNWHIKQVKKEITPTTQKRELAKFEIAKSNFSGRTKDIAMALCINDILLYSFDERIMEVISKLMDDFKGEVKDKGYYESLKKLYEKRMKLLKGKTAPDFSLPNIYQAPIALSDFNGKVRYIYFWGTAFKPSKNILKEILKLQKKYEDNKDVVFISIAMEQNYFDSWRASVIDDTLTGIQLYMEGEFLNETAKEYMINSLPFAMIVDKEGRIVTMKAPFLNLDKIDEIIQSLI
jgi:thiol-disulfide isomerase/thioredoxin